MPTVGDRFFPESPEGIKEARELAASTGEILREGAGAATYKMVLDAEAERVGGFDKEASVVATVFDYMDAAGRTIMKLADSRAENTARGAAQGAAVTGGLSIGATGAARSITKKMYDKMPEMRRELANIGVKDKKGLIKAMGKDRLLRWRPGNRMLMTGAGIGAAIGALKKTDKKKKKDK